MNLVQRPQASMVADRATDPPFRMAAHVYGANDKPRVFRYAKNDKVEGIYRKPVPAGTPGSRVQHMQDSFYTHSGHH